MLLQTRQIDPTSLGLFVANYLTGAVLSGMLQAYFAASGWAGGNVLYITGNAPQTINGPVTFTVSPSVPYSGTTGTVSSTLWTIDRINSTLGSLSGYSTGTFVDLFSVQTVGGSKTFTGQTLVAWPINTGATVPAKYVTDISGVLQNQLTTFVAPNVVATTGDQTITGIKTFSLSPQVQTPVGTGDAVNKVYVDRGFNGPSFFINPVNTGLNITDIFIGRPFQCTGFVLGCRTSGLGPTGAGGILSGALYVVDLNNTRTVFQNFTMNSGVYSYVSGGLDVPITGMYRIGVDLTSTLSGISKLTVGILGVGAG